MALALTQLIANQSNVDAASYTTPGTLTPVANRPVLAAVASVAVTGSANLPTLTGGGLTWVAVQNTSSGGARLTVFIGRASASPSPSTVVIDFAGQVQTCAEWAFYDVAGGRYGDESVVAQNNQRNIGTTGTVSISVSLPGAQNNADSRCFAAARHNTNETTTPRASWTSLTNQAHGAPTGALFTEWRTDAFEATASASWATACNAAQLVVVELLATIDATVGVPVATASAAAVVPALTVRTLPPTADSGWGSGPWGTFPWGPGAFPGFDPGATPGEDFPGILPPLEHVIIGPGGVADYPPVVGGFSADEDVGFATLAGTVERDRALDQPDVYTDGAQWIVSDSATGHLVAAGDLLDPSFGAGEAQLKADGWSKRLVRRGERLLYQARGYSSLFTPANSEPYGATGDGFHSQAEDLFQLSTDGALRFKTTKGSDAWSTDDHAAFVANFTGLRPGVRRITGHLHATRDGENFKFRVNTVATEVGPYPSAGWVTLHDFSPGGTDADFDVDLTAPEPVLIIEARRTSGGAAFDSEMTLTGLAIYGIASGDDWTGSDVARDIAGRLGFAIDVEDTGFPVLPLDTGVDGVYQDALDTAAVLSGAFYRVTGRPPSVPVLEWHALGSRTWQVLDPEFPVEPVPRPRYDSVLVPYTLSNGVAQAVLEVTAEAIGAEPLPVSRAYGPVSLPNPLPNADGARMLGQQILAWVYPRGFAGQVTFSRVASPEGGFVTAHLVHSGDSLVVPIAGRTYVLPTKALHREGGSVTVTFADSVTAVDRLIARKARQILLKNPA